MTLDANEFIRHFLLHALPDGFHRIRYYGFLANGGRGDNMAPCWHLLASGSADAGPASARGNGDHRINVADFAICPECGITMRRIEDTPW